MFPSPWYITEFTLKHQSIKAEGKRMKLQIHVTVARNSVKIGGLLYFMRLWHSLETVQCRSWIQSVNFLVHGLQQYSDSGWNIGLHSKGLRATWLWILGDVHPRGFGWNHVEMTFFPEALKLIRIWIISYLQYQPAVFIFSSNSESAEFSATRVKSGDAATTAILDLGKYFK